MTTLALRDHIDLALKENTKKCDSPFVAYSSGLVFLPDGNQTYGLKVGDSVKAEVTGISKTGTVAWFKPLNPEVAYEETVFGNKPVAATPSVVRTARKSNDPIYQEVEDLLAEINVGDLGIDIPGLGEELESLRVTKKVERSAAMLEAIHVQHKKMGGKIAAQYEQPIARLEAALQLLWNELSKMRESRLFRAPKAMEDAVNDKITELLTAKDRLEESMEERKDLLVDAICQKAHDEFMLAVNLEKAVGRISWPVCKAFDMWRQAYGFDAPEAQEEQQADPAPAPAQMPAPAAGDDAENSVIDWAENIDDFNDPVELGKILKEQTSLQYKVSGEALAVVKANLQVIQRKLDSVNKRLAQEAERKARDAARRKAADAAKKAAEAAVVEAIKNGELDAPHADDADLESLFEDNSRAAHKGKSGKGGKRGRAELEG